MRSIVCSVSSLAIVLLGVFSSSAHAQMAGSLLLDQRPDITSDLQDPVVELKRIRQRRQLIREPADSLFRTSPLTPVRECFIDFENRLYKETDLKLGTSLNHVFQGITDNKPGTDDYGMSGFVIFTGTWDGWNKGKPCQGELTCSVEGRWTYGPPDPLTLGAAGLGSSLLTVNPFTEYNPNFLLRNLFWRQGSREAGWRYRFGRVTPDQIFGTSRHVAPLDTFLPIGTGAFAIAFPDSGLGWLGGIYVNDRVTIAGCLHDSNANRSEFGDPGAGDMFKLVELQVKILPFTENAGYSKFAFWHNDGTKDGSAINGSTGREGWGFYMKLEQELTRDGRLIAIGRWGLSEKDSAVFKKIAGGHLVYYDPFRSGRYDRMGFESDVVGIGYDWGLQTGAVRDESDVEVFYRFPLFPELDATVAYQAIFNLGNDPTNDFGSAISLRIRSTW